MGGIAKTHLLAQKTLPNIQMSFWSNVKTAFAFALGSILASLIFVAIGVGLLLAGYVIRNKEQKKAKSEQEGWKVYGGLAMMVLGAVIAGGTGFYAVIGEVGEEI